MVPKRGNWINDGIIRAMNQTYGTLIVFGDIVQWQQLRSSKVEAADSFLFNRNRIGNMVRIIDAALTDAKPLPSRASSISVAAGDIRTSFETKSG